MFNSTAVGTGCRAIIADRRIAPVTAGPAASTPGCGLTSAGPVPDSYDFFAELPCLAGIDTATAALLSARFPYVTPSGVVNGCGRLAATQVEQYVDGGYADSTGLATVAGLAPQLMSAIRQHNGYALANARPGQPGHAEQRRCRGGRQHLSPPRAEPDVLPGRGGAPGRPAAAHRRRHGPAVMPCRRSRQLTCRTLNRVMTPPSTV